MKDGITIYEKWEKGGITITPANRIVKMKYKKTAFDLESMRSRVEWVITVTEDGKIVKRSYASGGKTEYASVSARDFTQLRDRIDECVESANECVRYVDDSSEELILFHRYGREQILDRGLGNGKTTVGGIMCDFLLRFNVLP